MTVSYGGVNFERLGHASVRLETSDGRVLYIDPWIEVLDDVPEDGDLVLVTHDDFDHFDSDGIDAVASEHATVAIYDAVATDDLEFDVTPLPYDDTTTVEGIEFTTLPAYNDADGEHVDDEGDPFHAEGEVIGLLFDLDGTTVYYASDTDFLPELESIRTDVFLPPIGGHYTMNREEAVAFAESVDADLVLPVHYNTFGAIETDVEAFVEDASEAGIRVEVF